MCSPRQMRTIGRLFIGENELRRKICLLQTKVRYAIILYNCFRPARSVWQETDKFVSYRHSRASTGFDRDLEAGEAIRRTVALNLKLKLNADDNYALAAA